MLTGLRQRGWREQVAVFLGSQNISLFGTSLVQYAILWYITLETQSGVLITLSIICGFLPTFLLSPFAGVWADRYNRKRLIIISDFLVAVSTLVLALLMRMTSATLWPLFVLSAVRSFGQGIQMPAVNALLPQIVPVEKLTRVNAINGTVQSVIMIVSPLASAALMSFTTLSNIFLIDVVTAIPAILLLQFFLNVPLHKKAAGEQTSGYLEDMRSGLHYVRHHRFLVYFFIFYAFLFFLISPSAFLSPLQVTRSFSGTVWHLTAIELAFFIGMTLGGILMASWGGFRNRVHTMALSGFILGLCTSGLGLVPIFWIYLGIMGLIGFAIPIFNTPSLVILQEKVDENYLGRLFGLFTMLSSSMMPLGLLIFGPMADLMPIEWMLIATGVLLSLLSLWLVKTRALVEAGEPIDEPSAVTPE